MSDPQGGKVNNWNANVHHFQIDNRQFIVQIINQDIPAVQVPMG
jgi:hypothetical protein